MSKSASATSADRKASPTPSKSKVRRRNAKQVKRARITAEFVKNIPHGVTYSPGSGPLQTKATAKNAGDDIVKVGDFIFNVDEVSKATLISMRKFLPSEEYRLLKNRKSARLCRKKRKEERGTITQTLEQVKESLESLRAELSSVEAKLEESEKARKEL